MFLKLIALTLPLCLDSFLVACALGLLKPSWRQRLRISGFFAVFEGGMPLVGLALGSALSGPLGHDAQYLAIICLVVFGLYMVLNGGQEDEDARKLLKASGLAVIGLGLGISLDGLALGFAYGVLKLPVVLLTAIIVGQAFVAVQLGLILGSRVPESLRSWGEKLAGIGLVAIGLMIAVQTG